MSTPLPTLEKSPTRMALHMRLMTQHLYMFILARDHYNAPDYTAKRAEAEAEAEALKVQVAQREESTAKLARMCQAMI